MSPYVHEAVAHRSKRVRFSNEPSSPSASSESALASTNAADDSTTNPSDLGTSDSDSELSESSEEPSSEESSSEEEEEDDDDEDTEMEEPEGQDGVVNLRANRGKKPVMRLGDEDLGPDIRDFLKDFLPQLKAANDELEAQKKAGTLKSLDAGPEDEGEPYIEMNLGLGVLEEKDPNANSDSGSASDTEDGGEEKDVLGKLMGREKKKQESAAIEVVHNTTL